MSHNIPQGGQAYVRSSFGASEGWKCYFPCKRCNGLRTKIILIASAKKHCRDYGHTEGGHEYHLLVSYLLYVFVL